MDGPGVASILIASVATLLSLWAWISSNRAKRETTKFAREKSELEAFLRIESMYTNALGVQEAQLKDANERIHDQSIRIRELERRLNGGRPQQ